MKALPPPPWSYVGGCCGALLSLFGVHGAIGYERGSQIGMLNHGATDSSNQWVTSLPGVATVGMATGSRGRVSTQVTSLLEPGRLDRNRRLGSSCPM